MRQIERQLHVVNAAVLYENDKFAEPLKAAVAVAGAALAGEYRLSELNSEQLAAIQADVLVVNLELILDKQAGLLDLLLANAPGRIIFNDADATSKLTGNDMARWARHLAAKIMGCPDGLTPLPVEPSSSSSGQAELSPRHEDNYELWVLGASVGGPEALRVFFANLDKQVGMAFILVQHIGLEFIQLMSSQLNQVAGVSVRCALEGDELRPGQVLVVPFGKRLLISKRYRIHLENLPEKTPYSPCIDQVIDSVLERFGADAHAIIFSGMANDGIQGATAMMERGCEVWVQSPETCVVSSMVDGSLKAGGVTFSGSPVELAAQLNQRSKDQQQVQY